MLCDSKIPKSCALNALQWKNSFFVTQHIKSVMCKLSIHALMLVSTLFSLLIRGWAGGLGAKANFLIDAILVFTSLGFFGSSDRSQPRQEWGSQDSLPTGQKPRSLGAKLGRRPLQRKAFGLGVAPGLTIMTSHGIFITGFVGGRLGVEQTFSLYHSSTQASKPSKQSKVTFLTIQKACRVPKADLSKQPSH